LTKAYLALSFTDLVAVFGVEYHGYLPHMVARIGHEHALPGDGALLLHGCVLPHGGDGLPLPRENDFHLNETALSDGANLLLQIIDGDENGHQEVIRQ
jgi:hypothetical protein